MRIILLFVLTASIASGAESLSSEAMGFLDILISQGYRVAGIHEFELVYLEPYILYVPAMLWENTSGGILIAMGGNHILDLELELQGEGWHERDFLPDDFPILELDSTKIATSQRIVLRAIDMTHGCLQDSVVVMWILMPVDRN